MAKIIVADDEPSHLDLVATILERAGHCVTAVASGRTCLDHLDAQPFDLVVSDIFMPGMDGIQLMTEIGRRGLSVPLIAMTGGMRGHFEPFSDIIARLGASSVLTKPFTADQLLSVVNRCLTAQATGLD